MTRITDYSSELPPTIAQQIFTIGSALAGGAAGLVLARALVGKTSIPLDKVALATTVSIIFTFGAALVLAKSVQEEAPYVARR